MLNLSTSTHTLSFFPGDEGVAPYYSLAEKRKPEYATPKPLDANCKLSIENSNDEEDSDRILRLKLGDTDIGEFNDQEDEQSAANLAEFVSNWRNALSDLETKNSKSGSPKSIRSSSISSSTTAASTAADAKSSTIDMDHSRINSALGDYLEEIFVEKPVSIRLVTWNNHGSKFSELDLSALLGFPIMADMYIICLQEADLLGPRNLYANPATLAEIKQSVLNTLGEDYDVATSNQLLGIKTVVFARSWLKNQITNVRKATTGTGLFGVWGNKGAAGIWLTIGADPSAPENSGTDIGLINCHLSAGEDSSLIERRRWELAEISKKIDVPGIIPTNDNSDLIFSSNDDAEELSISDLNTEDENKSNNHLSSKNKPLVFLLGDLNYRIHRLDADMVCDFTRKKDYETILVSDQLSQEMKEGKIFSGLEEPKIAFPPSYKYYIGDKVGETFDTSERVPSYTDRILYTKNDKRISVDEYSLGLSYSISDHKPVMCRMELTLPVVNTVRRKELVSKILKEWDQEENSLRPSVDVSPIEINVDDAILFEEAEAWITIKHSEDRPPTSGSRLIRWEMIMDFAGGNDEQKIHVEPMNGDLPYGAIQKVRISFTPTLQTREIKHVGIVRIKDGQDIFVTIDFKSLPSALGTSLDLLSRMPDGARSGKIMDQSSSNMPLEIWNCIDYLWTRTSPDMFDGEGEPFLQKQIQEWLDKGKNFDIEVLDTANEAHPYVATYSVANQLIFLLKCLPEGIVPVQYYSTVLKGSDGVNMVLESIPGVNVNVLIYICGFLHKAIDDGLDEQKILDLFEPFIISIPSGIKEGSKQKQQRREFFKAMIG